MSETTGQFDIRGNEIFVGDEVLFAQSTSTSNAKLTFGIASKYTYNKRKGMIDITQGLSDGGSWTQGKTATAVYKI